MEEELKILSNFIMNWCEAVEGDASYDSWDDYFKDAYYRQDEEVYNIIRKYLTKGVTK